MSTPCPSALLDDGRKEMGAKLMASEPKAMNSAEWSLLVLLSVLWGGAFFFVGVAVTELPPLTIVLARVGMAGLILLFPFRFLGYSLPHGLRDWTPFIVMGLLINVLPFSLLNTGQTMISSGLTSIMTGMTPLFTAIVMASFREERLTWNSVIGVLLGVAGVAIISWSGDAAADTHLLGIGLCLAGALSYAFAALWGRRHLRNMPPLKSATCQLLSSTLIMVVVVAVVDRPWTLPLPGAKIWLALGGLALFGTAIAYIVFFEILSRAGASNVMLVTLLIPVTALLLGNLFLGEPIFIHELIGAATIGLGLLFIDGRLPRRVAHAVST